MKINQEPNIKIEILKSLGLPFENVSRADIHMCHDSLSAKLTFNCNRVLFEDGLESPSEKIIPKLVREYIVQDDN